MENNNIYTTTVKLNAEEAKNNIEQLEKKVQELTARRDALNKRNPSEKGYFKLLTEEINAAKKQLKFYESDVMKTIKTLDNLAGASAKDIQQAQKAMQKMLDTMPRDSDQYKEMTQHIREAKAELENIKAVKAFDEVQAGVLGTGKSARQLGAEFRFLRTTMDNIGTASVDQLEKALEVARQHFNMAKQGSAAYERAADRIKQISAQLEIAKSKQKESNLLIDKYDKEINAAKKDIETIRRENELINRTLKNLNTSNIQDIEYSLKIIKENMRTMPRGEAFEQMRENAENLEKELKKLNGEAKESKNLFSRLIDGLNKNWGAITQLLAAYSGVRDVIRGSVEAFAEMDQEMNNVRKYTGQSIEEVERMNEEFKKMDTRTPREQLNQLAGSAGRLGITSTSAVMEFVDAADKINVALGDDLGQGAVDKIGKLTMAFGEDETKGLRGAMLATGSAVNELAQNSPAQAGYLVDFTARLSGVGIQADLTQSQILGIAAAMDENMQRDEMAATALSQIITKMTTDSETFARIAGKNVEEFANLVRTDMNAALMQFFEAMNKKGGFTKLAPLFEEMGLDGTRAIGVLSTLSSKIDDVRHYQELANEAYEKGTSVIDEFNVQNETYQAQIEKARKAFADLRIELGEKLLPVASVAISTTSLMVRVLSTLINFFVKFRTTIALVTVTIGVFTAAKYKDIIATKLMNFWNVTLMGNIKKLYAIIMANPWAAAAVGVATLVGVIADLNRRTNEATVAQKALSSVEHDATVKAELERQKIEELRKKIHDNNLEVDKRREYIEKLQKIVPDYVAKISDEGRVYEESTEALDKYIQKIKEKAMVDGAKAKMEELAAERAELVAKRMEQNEKNQEYRRKKATGPRGAIPGSVGIWSNQAEDAVADAHGEALLKALDDKIAQTDKAIELMGKVAEDSVKTVQSVSDDNDNSDTDSGKETRSYWEKELKDRRDKLKALREDANSTAAEIEKASKAVKEAEDKMELFTGAKAGAKEEREEDKARRDRERKANDAAKAETEQQLAELTHRYAMGRILYCDYIDEQERIQLEGIERRMLIYRTESLEYQKLSRQREEMLLNGSEEQRKLTLAQLKAGHEERKAEIEKRAWEENQTEFEKNEALFREDMRFLDEQRILYRQGTLERINLERDIEQRQKEHSLYQEKYYQQTLQQVRERYLNMSNDRQMEITLKGLEELHNKQLLSEREYQEAKLAIQAQYANYETSSEHDQRIAGDALKVATNNAKQDIDQKNPKALDMPLLGDIQLYSATMDQLKQMYQSDQITHAQYLAAKQQATSDFCKNLASQMQAAYNSVNQVLSAASNYFSAQQEYETAQVRKKYEDQIAAAGNNQKKVKKLQEKQQKEEAEIKRKYQRKQMKIQIAQAIASTAMGAINAYSSAAQVPMIGYILAPIAAAMALAAGALQIAAIKKQQQAQEAGYYEGGFTGGNRYRREAGVVHEGEFVANHQAVNNPNVLPFLNFLDQAQRNNTVGSLTAHDISQQLGTGASSIVTPIVNVQTDNEKLNGTLSFVNEAIDNLNQTLLQGINATVVIDGPNGLDRQYKRFQKLNNRV